MPADANLLIEKETPRVPGWALLLFVVAFLAIGFVALGALPDAGMLAVLGVFFAVGLLAVAVAVAPLGRTAPAALGLRPAGWKYFVFGPLATVALSIIASQFGIEPEGMKQVTEIVRSPGQLALSLLLLAGLAPLVEELIFRGLVYGWLAGRWGSTVAWIVSSLAFAGAHWEPAHIVLVLPLGLMFGWLRRRSDSLLPSLAAHVVNNALALVGAAYI